MQTNEKYQCCFCGDRIEKVAPDPCSLEVITNFLAPTDKQHSQGLFCHLGCFEERLHPSIPQYLRQLLDDE